MIGNSGIPTGWEVAFDASNMYLTFVTIEPSKFKIYNTSVALQYSLNDGSTWQTLATNTWSTTIAANSRIMWKRVAAPDESLGSGTFQADGNFKAEGNPLSDRKSVV